MARVREFYPNVMRLDFASAMNLGQTALQGPKDLEKSLPELFEDFFKEQLGADMDDTETALVANVAGDTGEARQ